MCCIYRGSDGNREGRDDVEKVVVTAETVNDNVLPTIVPRKPPRNERREKTA